MRQGIKLILWLPCLLNDVVFSPLMMNYCQIILQSLLDSQQPVMFQMYLSGPLRPHRLLVFINPFGGKKKGRKIYHSLVAPLFELAGISSHVIGNNKIV